MKNKDVMIVTGAGQISMAIARRMGYGKKIVMGDKNIENANAIAAVMNEAGYDVEPVEMDLSSREIRRDQNARERCGRISESGSGRGNFKGRSVRNSGFTRRSRNSHRGARLNAIAPGIIVTLLAIDEFHGSLKPKKGID